MTIADTGTEIYADVDEEHLFFKLMAVGNGGDVFTVEANEQYFLETYTDVYGEYGDLRIDWSDTSHVVRTVNGVEVEDASMAKVYSPVYDNMLGEEMMNTLYAQVDAKDGNSNPCGSWAGVAAGVAKFKCMWGGLQNPVCIAANGILIACLIATVGCWVTGGC